MHLAKRCFQSNIFIVSPDVYREDGIVHLYSEDGAVKKMFWVAHSNARGKVIQLSGYFPMLKEMDQFKHSQSLRRKGKSLKIM